MIIDKTINSITINKLTLTTEQKQEIADFISEILIPKQDDESYDKYTRIFKIETLEETLKNTYQDIFTITVNINNSGQAILNISSY